MPSGHQGHARSKLGHFRGVASAAPREAAVGQCCSSWRTGRGQRVAHHGNRLFRAGTLRFLNTLGQVLRAIDLPFVVGSDFNLAGYVLEQPGCLHAARARIAAPSNDTPTCLDSTGKGKVIDFFVISEELHPFVRTVVVDERPSAIRTHWPVVPTPAGVKRGRLVQRLRRPARLSRVAPVGPSRRRPELC